MKLIQFSESDSRALKLRIGRSYCSSNTAIEPLAYELFAEKYDIGILKTDANNASFFKQLARINCPQATSGITLRYRFDYDQFQPKPYRNDWQVVQYNSMYNTVLAQIVAQTFGDEPIHFYDLPYYTPHLASQDAEIDTFYTYLTTFDNTDLPDRQQQLFFMQDSHSGEYIGFLAMVNYKTPTPHSEVVAAGIRPEFRQKGMYHDLIRLVQNHHHSLKLDYFTCGARLHNIVSQKTLVKEGLRATHAEMTAYLMPLLHTNQLPNFSSTFPYPTPFNLDSFLVHAAGQSPTQGYTLRTFRRHFLGDFTQSIAAIQYTYPIVAPNEIMMQVAHLFNSEQSLIGAIWLEYGV